MRRESIDAVDLLHGHIGGIDVIAEALVKAEAVIQDGQLDAFRAKRYAGWQGELGKAVHDQGATLAGIADLAESRSLSPQPQSGRQE